MQTTGVSRTCRPAMLTIGVLGVVLALAAAGCGGGSDGTSSTRSSSSSTTGGTTTIAGAKANLHETKSVSGQDEISMELDDFYFGPTILKGEPGQTLKIELENESGTEHNFSIDQQSLDQDVEGGQKATVSVTFPKSGVLQFYCKYHKQLGMVGGLQVGSGASSSGAGSTTSGGYG